MLSTNDIVYGIVLPIAIGVVVMAGAWRPWRRDKERAGRPESVRGERAGQWGSAISLALAYGVAHVGVFGWPSLSHPPEPVEGGLVIVLVLALVYTLLRCSLGGVWWAWGLGRVLLALYGAWLLGARKVRIEVWTLGELIAWCFGIGSMILLFWALAAALGKEAEARDRAGDGARRGIDAPLVLAGVAGLGAQLVVLDGKLLSGAVVCGAISLVLLIGAALAAVSPRVRMAPAIVPLAGVLLPSVWVYTWLWSEMSLGYVLVLVLAPGAALAAAQLVPRGAHNLVRTGLRVLLVATPLLIIVATEAAEFIAEQREAEALGY